MCATETSPTDAETAFKEVGAVESSQARRGEGGREWIFSAVFAEWFISDARLLDSSDIPTYLIT